MKVRCLHT